MIFSKYEEAKLRGIGKIAHTYFLKKIGRIGGIIFSIIFKTNFKSQYKMLFIL